MPKPRHHSHSQKELAALVGVTCATLRAWRDQDGIDLSDVEAVKARAGNIISKDESLAEARRRRAVAAADAEEIRVRRMKGELIETRIPRGVITMLDHRLGLIWKHTPNELAGILEGLSGGALREALKRWIDADLVPRFAQAVAVGLAEMDASFSELKKVLPPSES